MPLTLHPRALIVASAYPDPPFDLMENGTATGFDIELMRAICAHLGLALRPVPYAGDDFNGIFDGLANRSCDAVISGTTITPERCAIALFSQPYLEFNQGVAVNRRVTPNIASVADLRGLTAGIQSGNTSDACKKCQFYGAFLGVKGTIATALLPFASANAESSAEVALSCMVPMTWLYVSNVMPTRAWPSRSLATLG